MFECNIALYVEVKGIYEEAHASQTLNTEHKEGTTVFSDQLMRQGPRNPLTTDPSEQTHGEHMANLIVLVCPC